MNREETVVASGNARERGVSTTNLIRVLEDEILNGVLRPGHRLDEQALARRFNVSRTPVREALRHLASSGLVEIRRNQGATVRTLTASDLVEMFQVMAEFEGLCARLCARRMLPEEIDEIRRLNDECRLRAERGEHNSFFEANNEFHEAIYVGSRNTFLRDETRKLRNRINVYRRHITFQPRRMQRTVVEHAKIVKAIEQGDEDLAHQLMREHVDLLAGSAADVLLSLASRNSD